MADVGPAIVEVRAGLGGKIADRGAGFVIDAARGLVATNYHVIAGVEHVAVTFPFDKDKKEYTADGVVALSPGKDLAILYILSGDKKLQALKLAQTVPELDEAVVTIALPSKVIWNGEVIAICSGKTASELIGGYTGSFDSNATWIQSTLPVPPGNSGGPMLDGDGRVVGVNTWRWVGAHCAARAPQFAIAAKHLKDLLATAGATVQPLPRVRPFGGGDPRKVGTAWNAFNQAASEFDAQNVKAREEFNAVPLPDPNYPTLGSHSGNRESSASAPPWAMPTTVSPRASGQSI